MAGDSVDSVPGYSIFGGPRGELPQSAALSLWSSGRETRPKHSSRRLTPRTGYPRVICIAVFFQLTDHIAFEAEEEMVSIDTLGSRVSGLGIGSLPSR